MVHATVRVADVLRAFVAVVDWRQPAGDGVTAEAHRVIVEGNLADAVAVANVVGARVPIIAGGGIARRYAYAAYAIIVRTNIAVITLARS